MEIERDSGWFSNEPYKRPYVNYPRMNPWVSIDTMVTYEQ